MGLGSILSNVLNVVKAPVKSALGGIGKAVGGFLGSDLPEKLAKKAGSVLDDAVQGGISGLMTGNPLAGLAGAVGNALGGLLGGNGDEAPQEGGMEQESGAGGGDQLSALLSKLVGALSQKGGGAGLRKHGRLGKREEGGGGEGNMQGRNVDQNEMQAGTAELQNSGALGTLPPGIQQTAPLGAKRQGGYLEGEPATAKMQVKETAPGGLPFTKPLYR